MSFSGLVLLSAIVYLVILFLIAYWVDQHAQAKWVQNPYVYTLSLAVFCTSWTFYGSVGRAATTGTSFLAIYLGPILMFSLGYYVLRKILRICHQQHITSISDFISARYGGSRVLAGLVSIIAVIGILPYISLQLKAVGSSYGLIEQYSNSQMMIANIVPHQTELICAILLGIFAILFGTRKIDVTEQHRGMVGAIALESLVKLIAFLAVGSFVSFSLFDGVGDILTQASSQPELAKLLDIGNAMLRQDWWVLTALSMMAIICLPRQFQIMMVENVDEAYLKQAAWLFPIYLIVINLFVIPIAMAGRLSFTGTMANISPDTYVLALPMLADQSALTILVFIGGLSAATGMVIVASITLSTMICNDIVVPLLFRDKLRQVGDEFEITHILKIIRRITILVILLLGYLYVVLIGDSHTLVSIGLISFAAAVIVAMMIAKIGWDLVYEGVNELVDKGLETDELDRIKTLIETIPGVSEMHSLRSRQMGNKALIDVHVQVTPYVSVSEGHRISDEVSLRLVEEIEVVSQVLVHIDPENDEEFSRCSQLPLRSEALNLLLDFLQLSRTALTQSQRELLDFIVSLLKQNNAKDLVLHYHNGKIRADIFLPLSQIDKVDELSQLELLLQANLGQLEKFSKFQIVEQINFGFFK